MMNWETREPLLIVGGRNMETIAFIAIGTVGIISWLIEAHLGLILTIAMSTAFLVYAIGKGRNNDKKE